MHLTDLSRAWSFQIPFDFPRDPSRVDGGTRIVGRDRVGPAVVITNISHHQSIQQKRQEDDLEKLRKILSGVMQRPQSMMPNAEYHTK